MKSLIFRRWLRLASTVYILLTCQPVWAHNSCVKAITGVERHLSEGMKQCYAAGGCVFNTFELLRYVRSKAPEDFYPNDAKVLVITSMKNSLWMLRTREGIDYIDFHFTLEFRGNIYDLEYQDGGTPLPVNEYFKNMYLPSLVSKGTQLAKGFTDQVVKNDLVVMAIPALDFMHEYGLRSPIRKLVDYEYYLYDDEASRRYPKYTLDKVLLKGLPSIKSNYSAKDISGYPRLFIFSSNESSDPNVILWRTRDIEVNMNAETGEIYMFKGETMINDSTELHSFIEEIERLSKTDLIINSLYQAYKDKKALKIR